MFSLKKTGLCKKWNWLGFLLISVGIAQGADYLSPEQLSLINDGQTLLIAERTAKKLDWFDPASCQIFRSVVLPDEPRGLTCSTDGQTAFIVMGENEGTLMQIDTVSGRILLQIPVGHGPVAPVASADGRIVYVCNRFDHTVGIVDLETQKQVCVIPVSREPVAAALTPDGKRLFVANHLPDGPANVDYVASKVSVIDTASRSLIKTIKLVNGAEGMRGICVTPDGQYVCATHLMARYQVPTTQVERGWINANALSVIRVSDLRLLYTVLLDNLDRGFANPWAVTVSADSKMLCVSAAGNNELSLIDLPALTEKISERVEAMGKAADAMHLNAHNDLFMLTGLRKRIALKGIGPRALAMDGNRIYVAEYFSDSLGQVVLREDQEPEVISVPLGSPQPMTTERRGEMLFNNASEMCFQGWQSCASCHPDARMDALNWDLLNDGIGNPKNVKSLVLAHQTPPAMWLGVRDSAEAAVRAGVRYIQFTVRPEEDSAAIDTYLKNLHPTPSPYLVNGELSQSAERGKKLFEELCCIRCHPAPLFTDLKVHDVGTTTGQDAGRPVDTPSLVEFWRTAPYLHDGRAAAAYELFHGKGHAGIIKGTSALDEEQLKDLEAYLLSL